MGSATASRRKEQRFSSVVDVMFEGGAGISRNVSPSGIYFETESPLAPRALLTFSVDCTMPSGEPVRMKCEASIVRIEGLPGGRIGVGAEILGFSIVRPPGSNEPS
jgi:hypothetical protein